MKWTNADPRWIVLLLTLFYGLILQQAHTDGLSDLRFTLAFVHCVMELASSKDAGLDPISSPDVSFLEQSLVTDQISLLSREWRWDSCIELNVLPQLSSFTKLCGNHDICISCVLSSYAEQLVLYMKAEEFLSSALHTAKENIKQGKLLPSATVKQGETSDLWFWLSSALL